MHVAHKQPAPLKGKLKDQSEGIKSLLMPVFNGIDKYVVPPEKHKAVFDYTCIFYSKNQHMTHARVVRKVVEHFKLSLKK